MNGAAQVMYISTALGKAPGLMGLAMNPLTIGAFGLVGSEKVGFGANASNDAVDSYGYGVYAFVPVLKSKDGKNRAMTMSLEAQGYMAANMNFNGATGNAFTGAAAQPVRRERVRLCRPGHFLPDPGPGDHRRLPEKERLQLRQLTPLPTSRRPTS